MGKSTPPSLSEGKEEFSRMERQQIQSKQGCHLGSTCFWTLPLVEGGVDASSVFREGKRK